MACQCINGYFNPHYPHLVTFFNTISIIWIIPKIRISVDIKYDI